MLRNKLSLILVTITATLLAGCSRPGATVAPGTLDPAAEKITVEKGAVENRVVATGKVIARSQAGVAFARSGRVITVPVKEGDAVKKGQVIMALDSTDLQTSADQQWANFLSAQATYSQSIKGPSAIELAAAQAALDSAQAAYADLSRKPGANTLASLRASVQNAETTLRQRQAAISAASPDLASVSATLQNARASLQQRQAAYDRRAARDAGIGASPEALDLERATNDFNAAKANYDKTADNAHLDLERAQNDLERARSDYNAKFDKATAAQIASGASQIEQAKKNLAALQPVAET